MSITLHSLFHQLYQLISALQLRLSKFNSLSLSTPFHFRFHNLIKWPFCSVLCFKYINSKQNVCHSPLILISDNIIIGRPIKSKRRPKNYLLKILSCLHFEWKPHFYVIFFHTLCELQDVPSLDKLFQIILQHRMLTGDRTQIGPEYLGIRITHCVLYW